MSRRLVLDASALIALARLELLEAAAAHLGPFIVADAAFAESAVEDRAGTDAIMRARAAGSLEVSAVAVDPTLALGAGEAATIALAASRGAVAVLDDRDARRVAVRRGVEVTGTIAVLVRLLELNAIASVAACLDELDRMGFRSSPEVRSWALRTAGEG